MINKIIYLITILSFFACNSSQEDNATETADTSATNKDSLIQRTTEFNLEGTWGLTNYFDTISERKELAKFRLQTPTWFAILLVIENDTIKTFGSIESHNYALEKNSDTLTTLTSHVTGDKWALMVKNDELILIQLPNPERIDSTHYIFRKRNDLNYFTQTNADYFVIGNNVTDYFNEHLFEGTYLNKKTNQEIIFGDSSKLIGMEGYDSYKVRNYFGTLHPHRNLDVITFSNSKTKEYNQYNWVFSDDELILTEFIPEKVMYEGKAYDGDDLVLGKEKIKLKIIKH